jgi:predicted transcriptional regulator
MDVSDRVRWDEVTTIRLPLDLKGRIDEAARRQAQSRSAEIRRALAAAFPAPEHAR